MYLKDFNNYQYNLNLAYKESN